MKIKGKLKITKKERNRAEWRKLFERHGLPDTIEQIEAGKCRQRQSEAARQARVTRISMSKGMVTSAELMRKHGLPDSATAPRQPPTLPPPTGRHGPLSKVTDPVRYSDPRSRNKQSRT